MILYLIAYIYKQIKLLVINNNSHKTFNRYKLVDNFIIINMSGFFDKVQNFLYKAEDNLKQSTNKWTGNETFKNLNKDNINTKYESDSLPSTQSTCYANKLAPVASSNSTYDFELACKQDQQNSHQSQLLDSNYNESNK